MRPRRLELEGFSIFSESTVVDFDGADLFALTGPTGAGKSSLIDAMCWALYGSAPRHSDGEVTPLVNTGAAEAKVRFEFSAGGLDYSVVRVARVNANTGRATVRDARLTCGDEVIAAGIRATGDSPGVAAAVKSLLGLDWSQFETCVVLPQGEFARFLHGTDKDRQEILVALLGLDIYGRMAKRANERASTLDARVLVLESTIKGLATATPAALSKLEDRLSGLADLVARCDTAAPQIAELEASAQQARRDARDAQARSHALAGIHVPAGVAQIGSDHSDLERALADARARCDAARAARAEAASALERLPDKSRIESVISAHVEEASLADRLVVARATLVERERTSAVLADAVVSAELEREQVRHERAAHVAAEGLTEGEPCPVCAQLVASIPKRKQPRELTVATEAVESVKVEQAEADRLTERARLDVDGLERDRERVAAMASTLTATDAAGLLAQRDRLDGDLRAAGTEEETAAAGQREVEAELRRLSANVDELKAALARTRETLRGAGLNVPAPASDFAVAWHELGEWAGRQAPLEEAAALAARDTESAADKRLGALTGALGEAIAAAGIATGQFTRQRDACSDALAKVRADTERMRADIETVRTSETELVESRGRRDVARMVGRQLDTNHFEKWLLREAVVGLITVANHTLAELSNGQYELLLDTKGDFAIKDLHNASAQRSIKTLSGGETFLASLSLALALADRTADLAAAGAPRVESIFLDEGFGTLDPETLDIVAGAIENLGATGRTVGIVTHVAELAERVPVRFEVRRTPRNGSKVERIEQ